MIITALLLGFAGSFHCMGMCSPLAMAVTNRSGKFLLSSVVYNTGRIFTYALLGSVIATVGLMLPLNSYQGAVSIVLGIFLLVIGITGSSVRLGFLTAWMTKFSVLIKSYFLKFMKGNNLRTTFFMGILNGMLPCGLSFLALTYCVTLGGPIEGFYFMLLFGLGTIPAMIGISSVIKQVTAYVPIKVSSLTTIMLVVTGVLLIVRVFIVHLPHAESFQQGAVDIVICGQ